MRFLSLQKVGLLTLIQSLVISLSAQTQAQGMSFFKASHPYFQYTGRVDFSNADKPRFWSSGVCIKAKFKGNYCAVILNDEILYGSYHNYIEILVDKEKPIRLKTRSRTDTLVIGTLLPHKLSNGTHTILICKNTEDGIGYLEFPGLICKTLLPLSARPARKIECIGNSITCGMSSDLSEVPCGKGEWYD